MKQILLKNLLNPIRSLELFFFVLLIKLFRRPLVEGTLLHRKINLFTRSASFQTNYSGNQKGIALVVTLLALVLITAMVVEFSYGVYTGTNDLYNWRDSQRLSLMAKSGVNVSAKFILSMLKNSDLKYTEPIELPVENPFEDFNGTITVRIEDETSKFNVNSLISSGGVFNEAEYKSFQRLLKILSLDEKIADRVLDWIDKNSEARLPDSEINAKNSALDSIDELLLINGITRKDYDSLLPYITVYGSGKININMAGKPVLMCLSDGITDEVAQRIIDYRKNTPFKDINELQKNVHGITLSVYGPIQTMITVSGELFYIRSSSVSGGIKSIIEAVYNSQTERLEYWKEY